MNKQQEAKDAQGYRTEQRNCGNCLHRTCEVALSAWMVRRNEESKSIGLKELYSVAKHGDERNQRCSVGGFAIKKTATCERWTLRFPA